MRKDRRNLAMFVALVMLMTMLAACVAPTAEGESSSSPVPTADVTLSTAPTPSPAPATVSSNPDEFLVGKIIWGPQPTENPDALTSNPTFHEELLADQSGAQEFARMTYRRCRNGAPALASAVYAFPSIAAGCYLGTTDPAKITHTLYYSENGGEIQDKLLAGLEELLTGKGTTLEVVRVSGLVRMAQAYVVENRDLYSILGFSWSDPFLVEDAIQLKVTRLFADGDKEIGYFDYYEGECLSIPADVTMVD